MKRIRVFVTDPRGLMKAELGYITTKNRKKEKIFITKEELSAIILNQLAVQAFSEGAKIEVVVS